MHEALNTPASDYDTIRDVIRYLSETRPEDSDLNGFAAMRGMSQRQMTDLFRRWCGLTPKSFAQAVALDHAKKLLRQQATMLETSFEVGLSSASRLHDLFVTHEAMPPGAWQAQGRGVKIIWGAAQSPFGTALLFTTEYGLAGIGFAEPIGFQAAYEDMAGRWPLADFVRDDTKLASLAARIFEPSRWDPEKPVRIVLIGTDFEVQVWQTLLKIPLGQATTYGQLAQHLGTPKAARAIGGAVGRNPISFVVPCHRVVASTGKLTGYHWGIARKQAMLGWEAGVSAD